MKRAAEDSKQSLENVDEESKIPGGAADASRAPPTPPPVTPKSREQILSEKPQTEEERKAEEEAGRRTHGFNQWLSDRLSLVCSFQSVCLLYEYM